MTIADIGDAVRVARHRVRRASVFGSVFAQQMFDEVRTIGKTPDVGTAWIIATRASEHVMGPYLRRELEMAGLDTHILLHEKIAKMADDGFRDGIPDVAVVRSMRSTALVGYRELERRGVPLMNSVDSTLDAQSKIETAHILHRAGVKHPESEVVGTVAHLLAVSTDLGWPVVVKAEHGWGGKKVWLATSAQEAVALGEQLLETDGAQRVLVQAFVDGPTARDVRAYVVRNETGRHEVIAALIRQGPTDDFRANGPRGLHAWRIAPDGSDPEFSPASVQTAVDGARAMNLEYAGVDVSIPTGNNTGSSGVVFEVNGSAPGFTELDARFPRQEHAMPHLARRAAALAQSARSRRGTVPNRSPTDPAYRCPAPGHPPA